MVTKYNIYRFDVTDQGCRYWIHCVINLFESEGHISDMQHAITATDALETVWASGAVPMPAAEQSPIIQGNFNI